LPDAGGPGFVALTGGFVEANRSLIGPLQLRRFPKSVLSCLAEMVHSTHYLRGSGIVNGSLSIVTERF
jgi:hypothetical protein